MPTMKNKSKIEDAGILNPGEKIIKNHNEKRNKPQTSTENTNINVRFDIQEETMTIERTSETMKTRRKNTLVKIENVRIRTYEDYEKDLNKFGNITRMRLDWNTKGVKTLYIDFEHPEQDSQLMENSRELFGVSAQIVELGRVPKKENKWYF